MASVFVPQPVAAFMSTLVFGADGSVTVGDEIELANEVDVVTNVFEAGQGLFNPQTVNGDIVVD
jgi:hypothetical protein